MASKFSTYLQLHKYPLLFVLGTLVLYGGFAYDLDRADFPKLITFFAALFFFQWKLIQFEKWNFTFLWVVGILFRLVFLFSEPNLSQDFYRFIWDGSLINQGINPYMYTPKELLQHSDFQIPNLALLYDGMGSLSARNFSNYPPLNQLLFTLAVGLGGKSILGTIVATRIILILSDLGILYFGKKLLKQFNIATNTIFWFFLNPLVIIEVTGNLHYEGVMLFFFVWCIYLLAKGRWVWAGLAMGASISVKLVPLLFLPLLLKYLGLKKATTFYLFTGLTCLLVFLPFNTPTFVQNYTQTLGLWFSNFEFNAGSYNLIKWIGVDYFGAKPWELIKSYGKIIPYLTLTTVLLFSFGSKNETLPKVLTNMMWVFAVYLLLTAVVHPWYLLFLILLSLFTPYRFPLVWAALSVFSYYAYSRPDYKESLWLLALEYGLVMGVMLFEIIKQHHKK